MSQILFVLKCILLGIVEGVSEFLPISSTGHLIIFTDVLGMERDQQFMNMFNVVIQLGAILAVLLLFWPRIADCLIGLFRGDKTQRRFFFAWIIACVPAAFLGFFLDDLIETRLFSVPTVVLALVAGGGLMIVLEKMWGKRGLRRERADIDYPSALRVGLWQCLALWPGFSRSASTIMGGWSASMTTGLAAEFSFFVAIPIMFGASGLKLVKFNFSGVALYQIVGLVLGFLVAFLAALLVVRAFMAFLKRRPLAYFAYYRFALAGILLILLLTGVIA